jgi:type I restriction enzyme S subunit
MAQFYRLGDGCTIKHGYAFKSQSTVVDGDDSLPIVVNIGNFIYSGGFRFESTKVQRYTADYPEQFRLVAGDVLVVMTCQTPGGEILGVTARIPSDERTYLHNQRMGKVCITRQAELELGYLYYLFLSPAMNAHLVATSTGAKILHTAPGRIENFKWRRPPLAAQRRIADILAAYDGLIENNTKRIKVVEEMAHSLYREWFANVRFPGYAKESLVGSSVGSLPVGWQHGTLEDVLHLQRGFDITKAQQHPGPYPVISSSGPGSTHDEYKAEGPGLVIGRKGTLGNVFYSEGRYWPHDTSLWVTEFHGHGPWFCYFMLKDMKLEQYDCGSSNPTLNRNHLHKLRTVVPPRSLTAQFDTIAERFMRMARVLRDKSDLLRRTRDLLLPRLISGELDVSSLSLPVDATP